MESEKTISLVGKEAKVIANIEQLMEFQIGRLNNIVYPGAIILIKKFEYASPEYGNVYQVAGNYYIPLKYLEILNE